MIEGKQKIAIFCLSDTNFKRTSFYKTFFLILLTASHLFINIFC